MGKRKDEYGAASLESTHLVLPDGVSPDTQVSQVEVKAIPSGPMADKSEVSIHESEGKKIATVSIGVAHAVGGAVLNGFLGPQVGGAISEVLGGLEKSLLSKIS